MKKLKIFLKSLQNITNAYNGYGYIEFLSDRINNYIAQYIKSCNDKKELQLLIKNMQEDAESVYENYRIGFENEVKRKDEAAQKLKEEHMKVTECGPICDCAKKAYQSYNIPEFK